VSPPNILVGYRGMVKLTDFGLAKHAIKRELTNPGVVYGRFSYLSPEQALGMPVDRRSDVFAAGIILWELLTGRQLYPAGGQKGRVGGKSLTKLHAKPVTPPSSVVPGIPRGLDEVVLRALERDTDRRYQTAEALRTALSGVLSSFAPGCDVDRIAGFMSDIFAKEIDVESRDYGTYVQEDFSEVRSTGAHRALEEEAASRTAGSGGWSGTEVARRGFDLEAYQEMAQARTGRIAGEKYKLKRLVGMGAMGAVYEAEHLTLGRIFALKVLHPEHGLRPELVDRMWREAQAATRTGHPNIVNVIDTGMLSADEPYLVMELVAGEDLGKILEDTERLDARRAVEIVMQLCRGLSAAHAAGIIHRDIKPENIMVSETVDGQLKVKLFDFGLCGDAEEVSASLTTPGMVLGSPDYMAPEQAAGAAATTGFDMYSLGSVLFKMLTGRVPFQGRNAIDVLMKKGAMVAPSVRSLEPAIPVEIDSIVADCLDRDPSVRPQSALELERRLEGCFGAVEGPVETPAALAGVPTPSESMEMGTGRSLLTVHQQAAAAQSMAGEKIEASRRIVRALLVTAGVVVLACIGVWFAWEPDAPSRASEVSAVERAGEPPTPPVVPALAGSEPAEPEAPKVREAVAEAPQDIDTIVAACERAMDLGQWHAPSPDNAVELLS
ncbi:MAG: protein kinase domain-containing protein, partial [Nannocystaceae bacterium]